MAPKKSRSELIVFARDGTLDHGRVALPPKDRRLNFGSRWDYAPAPEEYNNIQTRKPYPLFINGKFVAPRSGKYLDSINPATEEKLAEIAQANVDLAVKAARRARDSVWEKCSDASATRSVAHRITRGRNTQAFKRIRVSGQITFALDHRSQRWG